MTEQVLESKNDNEDDTIVDATGDVNGEDKEWDAYECDVCDPEAKTADKWEDHFRNQHCQAHVRNVWRIASQKKKPRPEPER